MSLTFFTQSQQINDKIFLIEYAHHTRTKRLFHAVAQGFVYLLKSKLLPDLKVFRPLLRQHANYYPRQLPKHIQKLNPFEQFEYMLVYTQPHAKTLVPSLAFTLQQMAVDAMCAYPEQYGNLLLEGKKIEELRKASNIDAPCVLQALADEVLKLNIYVERYPDAYLLPVKEYYLSEADSNANLYIHYQDNHYTTQDLIVEED